MDWGGGYIHFLLFLFVRSESGTDDNFRRNTVPSLHLVVHQGETLCRQCFRVFVPLAHTDQDVCPAYTVCVCVPALLCVHTISHILCACMGTSMCVEGC
jgi:hypothetical protein